MINRATIKTVIIIGAGPAGLATARRLKQLGIQPILLEKEDHVGGKCKTYSHPDFPKLKTEYGATAIAPNYGVILDIIREKGFKTEKFLPLKEDSVEFMKKMNKLSFSELLSMTAGFFNEWRRFNEAVKCYKKARDNLEPLPPDLKLPFAAYAKKYKLPYLNLFLKPLVPGFGYGTMDICPTYSILEYMGYGTIPDIIGASTILRRTSLIAVQGGMQRVMEELAKDFFVETSAEITLIDRGEFYPESPVTVCYRKNGEQKVIQADALVLAISPLHWSTLDMKLTETEQLCVDTLNYYRYPVAVCRLKGLPPNSIYIPSALEPEGLGHVAFLTTRDNRENPEDGRLCTVYINLPPGQNDFTLSPGSPERKMLEDDLLKLPGVTEVMIDDVKIWEDYFSSLDWGVRVALEKEQFSPTTHTMYAGSYTLGSFEDIACVTTRATEVINKHFGVAPSFLEETKQETSRIFHFFTTRHEEPVSKVSPLLGRKQM